MPRSQSPRLFCITHAYLSDTNAVLETACAARGIDIAWVLPDTFVHDARRAPRAGDLLYRAAAGIAADRIERLLWRPDVAAFYADPFFECAAQSIWMQRCGVAMPRTAFSVPRDREALARAADSLGGFPLVLKVPGGEGGTGVLRADSLAALFSLIDYVPASAVLMEYVEHTRAYRLIVVGEQVVAAEARHPGPFDFRTNSAGNVALGAVRAPAKAKRLALAAARALKFEFGGADVLEAADGRMVLAEFNFPCHFADQQAEGGIDIAGAMIDYLLAKSTALMRGTKKKRG
ncbi:MAG: hypothetical protein JNJ55_12780 [Betaproteobacteria bacterium]|nr:hypothetical protein [Betaproteobacteria bacterium]